eukprot:43402_1
MPQMHDNNNEDVEETLNEIMDTVLNEKEHEENKDELNEWFKTIYGINKCDAKQYYQLFVDNGYEVIDSLQYVDVEELKEMGIVKRGHQKLIINAINAINTVNKKK